MKRCKKTRTRKDIKNKDRRLETRTDNGIEKGWWKKDLKNEYEKGDQKETEKKGIK